MRKIILVLGSCLFCVLTHAQTITLTPLGPETYCSGGIDSFSVNWNNAVAGSNIVFYQSTNPAFNPYLGQGDSIGFIHIDASTTSSSSVNTPCARILGIFIDACNPAPHVEYGNEYIVMTSGAAGFTVNTLSVDFPSGKDINNGGSSAPWGTPSASFMTLLRVGTCTGTTLLAAGPGSIIPPNALVIIFTGSNADYPYNFSSYCSSGQPIYILQSSFAQTTASFANNAPPGCASGPTYRTTIINVGACHDAMTYDPCSLPPFDPANQNAGDGDYAIRLGDTDTSSTFNGGIQNNAADKCNGVVLDSILGTKTITYTIPADGSNNPLTNFCNTGFHYIKAITHPNGTQPVSNTIKFQLVCINITATPQKSGICNGENAVINNSSTDPNAAFSWTVNADPSVSGASAGSGAVINQVLSNTSTTTGSVTYTITSKDTSCTATTTVKMDVNPSPKPNITGNLSICPGSQTTLDAGAGFSSYTWTKGGTNVGSGQTLVVNAIGQYIVTVTKNGCTGKDTVDVIPATGVKPDITGSLTFCTGSQTTLDAGAGFDSYAWTKGVSNVGGNQTLVVISAGQYIVTVTKNGCSGKDTVDVIVSSSLKPDITGNLTFCTGSSTTLDAGTGFDSYAWTKGVSNVGGNQTLVVNAAGQYIVTVTKNGCIGKDTSDVTQAPDFNFTFGTPTTTICKGKSIDLDAGLGFSKYVWNTGATTQSITVTMPGKYWVDVTKNGCTKSDTITVIEIDVPPAFSIGADTAYCGTFSRTFNAPSAQTVWTRNGTQVATGLSYTTTQAGTYVAKITNSCGSSSATINITNPNAINLNLGKDTVTICTGTTTTLNATVPGNNIQYTWTPTGEHTPAITVGQFGKYVVEVSNGTCTVKDSVFVDVIDAPTVIPLGNDTLVCGDLSLQLFTGDATTVWSTGVTGIQITVKTPDTYSYKITNQCGVAADTIVIQQFDLPVVNIGKDTTICDSVTLTVGNGNFTSILWNTQATDKSITVSEAGIYFVDVTNDKCKNSDSIHIKKECFYDVYIPTAFTPNGDGVNDTLVPLSNIKGMLVIDFSVFNRWGEKVFESSNFIPKDSTHGWLGTYKGGDCPVDDYVYYFTAKMPDGVVKTYKGTVALLR